MADSDKILQALERLEVGQQVMQKDISSLQTDVKSLHEGQKSLQTNVRALQTDVKNLKEGQETLELKVEAFHAEQTKANTQVLAIFTNISEINAKDLGTRVIRIENHLNLPPMK
jgi:uncharacterized protein (DUF3084 family)